MTGRCIYIAKWREENCMVGVVFALEKVRQVLFVASLTSQVSTHLLSRCFWGFSSLVLQLLGCFSGLENSLFWHRKLPDRSWWPALVSGSGLELSWHLLLYLKKHLFPLFPFLWGREQNLICFKRIRSHRSKYMSKCLLRRREDPRLLDDFGWHYT